MVSCRILVTITWVQWHGSSQCSLVCPALVQSTALCSHLPGNMYIQTQHMRNILRNTCWLSYQVLDLLMCVNALIRMIYLLALTHVFPSHSGYSLWVPGRVTCLVSCQWSTPLCWPHCPHLYSLYVFLSYNYCTQYHRKLYYRIE